MLAAIISNTLLYVEITGVS